VIAGNLEAHSHAITLRMVRHTHLRIVCAHDLNPARAEIHANPAAGDELGLDGTLSKFLDFCVLSRNESGVEE
jgi:hypothetical protein